MIEKVYYWFRRSESVKKGERGYVWAYPIPKNSDGLSIIEMIQPVESFFFALTVVQTEREKKIKTFELCSSNLPNHETVTASIYYGC